MLACSSVSESCKGSLKVCHLNISCIETIYILCIVWMLHKHMIYLLFFFFKCSTVVYLYAILNAGTVINDDKLSELVARVLMLV